MDFFSLVKDQIIVKPFGTAFWAVVDFVETVVVVVLVVLAAVVVASASFIVIIVSFCVAGKIMVVKDISFINRKYYIIFS